MDVIFMYGDDIIHLNVFRGFQRLTGVGHPAFTAGLGSLTAGFVNPDSPQPLVDSDPAGVIGHVVRFVPGGDGAPG